MPHIEIVSDGYDHRAHSIDDQVDHGVGQARRITEHWLLHVHAEEVVHREFKHFPYRSNGKCKAERKERDEPRTHVEINARCFVEHVHKQETEDAQQYAGGRMERDIPPPELAVEFTCFAEKLTRRK